MKAVQHSLDMLSYQMKCISMLHMIRQQLIQLNYGTHCNCDCRGSAVVVGIHLQVLRLEASHQSKWQWVEARQIMKINHGTISPSHVVSSKKMGGAVMEQIVRTITRKQNVGIHKADQDTNRTTALDKKNNSKRTLILSDI